MNCNTHHSQESRLRPEDITVPHGTTCQANSVTRMLVQIGFRPTIYDNIWMRITINRLEMLQIHVDDIIITVHDLSSDTYRLQPDCKDRLVTMQSVGSDNIPLHRYNLACPHHLSAVPTGAIYRTYLYDSVHTIEIPTMDGVSQNSTVTERCTNAQQMVLKGLGIPRAV
jgi:hypothetical protein